MKLLEDVSSSVTHRPPPRRGAMTLALTSVLLVLAAAAGLIAVISSGGLDDGTATRSDWVASATQVCSDVAGEHPIMTEGAPARTAPDNLADVAAGTQALASGIDELRAPADDPAIDELLSTGERASSQWSALVDGTAEVTAPHLAEAADLTAAIVTGLNELGADCSALG
ncbi:hypothetical protein [Haloactinopolyspora sp.]|uniref:hypothetical protein n=1 Tax=Haloactinopolyspora sp. TaxID=1966353 RepID=UPI002609A48F|nr:hypothetical protein [Haloactinopolyspora sp.]